MVIQLSHNNPYYFSRIIDRNVPLTCVSICFWSYLESKEKERIKIKSGTLKEKNWKGKKLKIEKWFWGEDGDKYISSILMHHRHLIGFQNVIYEFSSRILLPEQYKIKSCFVYHSSHLGLWTWNWLVNLGHSEAELNVVHAFWTSWPLAVHLSASEMSWIADRSRYVFLFFCF